MPQVALQSVRVAEEFDILCPWTLDLSEGIITQKNNLNRAKMEEGRGRAGTDRRALDVACTEQTKSQNITKCNDKISPTCRL